MVEEVETVFSDSVEAGSDDRDSSSGFRHRRL